MLHGNSLKGSKNVNSMFCLYMEIGMRFSMIAIFHDININMIF